MPIAPNVSRIVLSGPIDGGGDWSTGFWVSSGTDADTLMGDIGTDLDAGVANLLQFASPSFHCNDIAIYHYVGGGSQADSVAHKQVNHAGGLAASALPLSTALVASLRTAKSGARHRGRMFVPFQAPMDVGGNVNQNNNVDTLAAAVANYLGTVRGDAAGATPVVMSTKLGSVTPITTVIVDSLPDTIRNRDSRLTAKHTSTVPLPSS